MKTPKGFKGKYFSLAAILALSTNVTLANETQSFQDRQNEQKEQLFSKDEELISKQDETPIIIVSKKSKIKEVDATFASEIYTKRDIKKSQAKDIYEFLNSSTSITTIPTFGNPFTQKIDLRGYGLANGYENIVITLDGQRLNNIDSIPQLLSQIPLENIDKIEILKGTGSVEYGDGSNAGVINIITKDTYGANIKTYFGNNSKAYTSLGFGTKIDKIALQGYFDIYRFGGAKDIDTTGQKDEAKSSNKSLKLTYNAHESLSFYIGKNFSNMDVFYPNALTLDQFNKDPKTVPDPSFGSLHTQQKFDIDKILFGSNYQINEKLNLDFDGSIEDKTSAYVSFASKYKYNTKDLNVKLQYSTNNIKSTFGISSFDGNRKSGANKTEKNNLSAFLKADINNNIHTCSIGARIEKVDYAHNDLNKDEKLYAYELGYSYKLDYKSSFFISYNHSFLAPNIDMFFLFGGGFNGFIEPMKVDTINAGYSYLGYPHKLKISSFYSKVKDEIYYNPTTWANTNIKKTSKYGAELSYNYRIKYNLSTDINYAYVDTKIDSDPTLKSGEIPGVSKHNVKLAINYKPTHKTSLSLSHTYRSKAYAMSDFDKSFGKMKAYNSTDLKLNYKMKNIDLFAKVDNIFESKNALFSDGGTLGVYPVNYQRSFLIGMSAKF